MKIELVPITEADFPLIVEWVNVHDEDFIFQWAGSTYKYPLTIKQMKDHYRTGINLIDSGVYIYKIFDLDNQETIGTVQLGKIDLVNKEAVVGRFLIKTEQYRGNGIGTYVLKELVRVGFEELSLQRIKLNVFNMNTGAIRCYEKVGFIKGQTSESVYQSLSGDYWDRIEMTLDKELWEQYRRGH